MKISDIRATSVSVPIEAPLRHVNGCHWGRFVRTIVEVETDNGLVGLGEMGGGGGKLKYENGAIAVPAGPGLGVKLDHEKVAEYSELYHRLGSYAYNQDPLRLGWTPTIPNDRWADPSDARYLKSVLAKQR